MAAPKPTNRKAKTSDRSKVSSGRATTSTSTGRKTSNSAVSKSFTKAEILSELSAATGLEQTKINGVLGALSQLIERHLKKGGVGVFVMPGLLKIRTVHKAATKARKGVNPFTGLETTFKAKPAHHVVKVVALKKLKTMV